MYYLFVGSEEKEGINIEEIAEHKIIERLNEILEDCDNPVFTKIAPSGMYDLTINEYCLIQGKVIVPKAKEAIKVLTL